MVASWGYFVAFDLLRELMGKLLRQGRLVQFLLDLFHGSDWSLSRSMRFDFTVIVGSFVQTLLSAFEPVRKLWWPFPFTEYAHSNHVVTNIVMSASGTGITITSLILWYIVCGFVRMAYRLVTRVSSCSVAACPALVSLLSCLLRGKIPRRFLASRASLDYLWRDVWHE
ncbi:hypothetical protein B0H11DRAFT_1254156 [Mycena galericulata]|nr:hypothetical protein B0H11DRAFT_1254156 [Mycena galericulata]